PGSRQLGEKIAGVFADGADCAMLENHGVVVGGRDLQQAFQRFETLEFCAKTVVKASQLRPVRLLSPQQLELSTRRRRIVETFEPGPATTIEKEARQLVADFVRRG